MYELLEKLIHVPGIPGYEHKVRELIAQNLPESVETATDNMGNLIATIGGGDNAILCIQH
jgi:endoglucanase